MLAIEAVKKLKRDSLPLLTVLAGEDAGQYRQVKQALLEQLTYDPSDLTNSYFDLAERSYQEAEMDLESLPFFADDKLVILDNLLDITTQKKHHLEDQELKRLEAYLENPVETTHLLILAPGKLDSKRRLVKLLKRDALVIEASEVKEADLRAYFQKEAQQLGLAFEPGAFEDFFQKSGADFSQLLTNLTFLKTYRASGAISRQDVQDAIPKSLQDNIFDLTQLILAGQVDQARSLVQDLTLQGEDQIKLIAVMLNQFRLYTQLKTLLEQGRPAETLGADLAPYLGRQPNPYQIRYALRDSKGLSLIFLRQAMQVLIETDFQIKTGVYDKTYLFDLALLKIVSSR